MKQNTLTDWHKNNPNLNRNFQATINRNRN